VETSHQLDKAQHCLAHSAQAGQAIDTKIPTLAQMVERFAAVGIETSAQYIAELDPEVLFELERRVKAGNLDNHNDAPIGAVDMGNGGLLHTAIVAQGGAA
jgi:hypothetical protein